MKKESNLQKFVFAGIFVLLGILLFNSFFVFSIGNSLDAKIVEAKEMARPAKIELIKLTSSCTECFDISEIIETLKQADLEITGEKSLPGGSKEAKNLIKKYGIEKLPAVILKGEIEKPSIQNFDNVDDALIFTGVTVPYEDAAINKIMGKVSSIIISDKNCEICNDFGLSIVGLKQSGVFIDKEEEFDYSSSNAKELIDSFAIEKLPALLLSDDMDAYPEIAQSLGQAGSKIGDYYILESQAPYVETESGKIRGFVNLIMLEDSSCSECYDVEIHKSIMARFGLAIDEESTIDAGSDEGKQLISKYEIKKIPTIVLSGDIDIYEDFKLVWEQVGTVEEDGAYAFRNLEVMGSDIVYKDVATNEINGLQASESEQ